MNCHICNQPILYGQPTISMDANIGACAAGAGNWKQCHSSCMPIRISNYGLSNAAPQAPEAARPGAESPPAQVPAVAAYERLERLKVEAERWLSAVAGSLGEGHLLGEASRGLRDLIDKAATETHPDSARYWWLADKVIAADYGDHLPGRPGYFIAHCKGAHWIEGKSLDEAIDTAIANEHNQRRSK